MSEDQNPGATLTDGTRAGLPTATGAHSALPNAPGWFSGLLNNPVQMFMLVGVLSLSGVEVGQLVSGNDPEDIERRLQDEIARVESENENRALLEQAARCSENVEALASDVDRLEDELKQRDDDKFAFMSEITQYVARGFTQLLKHPPEQGPRLEEYVKKGTLRGVRQSGD